MIAAIILLVGLTACVQPIILVAAKSDAIDPQEVSVYLARRPDCDFETVGYLSIESGYYSQASLLAAMRQKAAKVGANGIFVHETRRLELFEYIGTASAIRCIGS